MIFPTYRFENPTRDDHAVTMGGWSYLWAGLFGALYVATKGHHRQIGKAVLINIGFLALYIAIAGASSALAPVVQLGVIVLLVPFLVILQGRAMIRLIRNGFRRRGWWVQRA